VSGSILVERREVVGILTLEIPKTRNALSREVLNELVSQLELLFEAEDCRAIVLTGSGGHFCSGGDVSGMKAERTLPVGRARMKMGQRVASLIVEGPKPVIVAVEGYAAGAGLSLAALADYHVASTTAKYIASFGKVGMLPDLGLLWSLPQRIGLVEAKRMFMTCRTVEAVEAEKLGLVDLLTEPGKALDTAIEVALNFNPHAPLPVALLKSIYAQGCTTLSDALRSEFDNQPPLQMTQDHREAVAAFLEKRKPTFRGV
jgi:2-(1,2-epoxy-1,2-dihydrophenyl)acetyl-CoA isomerase